MTTTSMQFGQSAIDVVLNEGQFPAKITPSGNSSGGVVMSWPDGNIDTIGIRQTPVKVAIFGDSTANWGTPVSPDNQDTLVATAPFPASSTTTVGYPVADKGALLYLYPPATFMGQFGVSGETTTQMLARAAAGSSITRRAVIDMMNLGPDVVIFRGGSINDLLALSSASTQTDVDAVYTRHVKLLDQMASGVTKVIDEGFYGYSPGSGTAADIAFRRAAIASLNARYKAYAAASNGRITFIDVVGTLSNSDGSYISDVYESSGVHLNLLGSYLLGQLEAAALSRMFGNPGTVRFPGSNVITNALFTATSTAAGYGEVATGFTYGASSATRQNGKIETINGKVFSTIELVMTGADPYGSIVMPFTPNSMGIVADDVWGFEVDFLISTIDGSALPAPSSRYVAQVVLQKSAAGSVTHNLLSAAYTRPAFIESQVILHLSIPIRIQEASANITDAGSSFYCQFGTAVNGTYKIGVSNPRIVKLGTAQVTY